MAAVLRAFPLCATWCRCAECWWAGHLYCSPATLQGLRKFSGKKLQEVKKTLQSGIERR